MTEEIPISLHDGLRLDFATTGMMLEHASVMLGGEFWQIPTEEEMYLYSRVSACSVLLLHLCKRGFIFNWCVEVRSFFLPSVLQFLYYANILVKAEFQLHVTVCTKILCGNVCVLLSLVSLSAFADRCMIPAPWCSCGSATRSDWAQQERRPLFLTGWKYY